MNEFFSNRLLQAIFLPWFVAQISKPIVDYIRKRKLNMSLLTTAGGMPSSHSALVCALATAVGIKEGVASTYFVIAFSLAVIVMYDAAGVRRAASIQARMLNRIIDELFQGHPISETHLRELLGHTPFEVLVGAVLGIVGAWWWMTR